VLYIFILSIMNFAAIINKLEHYHIILIINICLCYPLLDVLMCNIYMYSHSHHMYSVCLLGIDCIFQIKEKKY